MAPGTGAPGPAAADFSASAPASADMPAVRAGGIGGGDGRAERARAAVYGAIEEVGRAAIAAELRGGVAAAAGLFLSGWVVMASWSRGLDGDVLADDVPLGA